MREVSRVLMALLRGPQCEVREGLLRGPTWHGSVRTQCEVSEVLMAVLSYNKCEVSLARQCLCVSAVPENVTQCVTVKGSTTTGFILKSSIQAAFNFPCNKENVTKCYLSGLCYATVRCLGYCALQTITMTFD